MDSSSLRLGQVACFCVEGPHLSHTHSSPQNCLDC